MTLRNLVKPGHLGKFEAHADEIIAMLLDGVPQREIAAKFGGTLPGLQLFAARHRPELEAIRDQAKEAVRDLWITDKVQRNTVLQELATLTLAEIKAHGLITDKVTLSEDGSPHFTRDYRAAMVKELRGLLKDAAIEEGQIVPAAPSKGGLMREVIIREYEGVPQEWIG